MKRARRQKAASAAFRLEAQCTLREAEAFKVQLLERADSSGDFIVDGSAVERIDTAGLQLLLAFSAHLALAGRGLVWSDASAPLLASAQRLGLIEALGLEAAA